VHTPTLKPFDTETVLAEVDSDRLVVTCENHTVVRPGVPRDRQNAKPVAILVASVASASSTRSWFTRLPMCSSIHIRAPPAPQHRPRSACRGISVSAAPDAPINSRGAS